MSGSAGHILHLATTHGARDPRIVLKEAQTLAAAGFRNGVVLPHHQDEVFAEVQIHAVPHPATGRDRLLHTTRAVVRRALRESTPDTVFQIHESELLPMALRLAWAGRRVVYDAHEDTPRQAYHQMWIPAPLRGVASVTYAALEAAAGRWFEGILAAVPAIAQRYPPHKTILVQNYPILAELPAGSVAHADREARIVYVGAITESRGVMEMIEAVRRLAPTTGAHLDLAGRIYPNALRPTVDAAVAEGLVTYHGVLGRPEVAALLSAARVGLVVLHPTPQYKRAYPTKLFEYMSAGLPVVASDFPIIRPFVAPFESGYLIDPMRPDEIANAIRGVLETPGRSEAMGRRGQAAVRDQFAWAREGERLIAFHRALAEGERRPGDMARATVG